MRFRVCLRVSKWDFLSTLGINFNFCAAPGKSLSVRPLPLVILIRECPPDSALYNKYADLDTQESQ